MEWQTRQLASFTATTAGAWGGDASELVRAAQELSLTGDTEDHLHAASPARLATGLEEWQAAARAQEHGADPGHIDAEMVGVPAGVRIDELPEMVGVPVSGPQMQAGELEVRGAGARIGAAEGLINALERGIAPQ